MNQYHLTEVGTNAAVRITARTPQDVSSQPQVKLWNKDTPMAIFYGNGAKTNAQKVCDLLNETARSQGKV